MGNIETELKFSHQRLIVERRGEKQEWIELTVFPKRGRVLPVCLEGRKSTPLEQEAFHQTVENLLEKPGASKRGFINSLFWLFRRLGVGDAYYSGGKSVEGLSEHGFRYWWLPTSGGEFERLFNENLTKLRSSR